jgi:hypothetical protein
MTNCGLYGHHPRRHWNGRSWIWLCARCGAIVTRQREAA